MKLFSLIFLLICIFLIIGQTSVKPTLEEEQAILTYFGSRKINSAKDLIRFQEDVLQKIRHYPSSNTGNKINILINIKEGNDYCFEKSLLMQKALSIYHIKTRPIFIFTGSLLSFLNKGGSDAAFEAKIDDKWYFVPASYLYTDFMKVTDTLYSLSQLVGEYKNKVKENNYFRPGQFYYIKYLFDRNGKLFGSPYWPDYKFIN